MKNTSNDANEIALLREMPENTKRNHGAVTAFWLPDRGAGAVFY